MNDNIKCAPGIKKEGGTCIRLETLKHMGEKINKNKTEEIIINNKNNEINMKTELFNFINNEIKNKDNKNSNQLKWIGSSLFKDLNEKDINELMNYTFRPEGPIDYTWLSNFDIEKIFRQYERIHNDFKFLGAVGNNFFTFMNFNKVDIQKEFLDKGITKLGIIFNTDNYGESGEHWVGCYINLNNAENLDEHKNEKNVSEILFCDSGGNNPKKEVKDFINYIIQFNNKRNYKTYYEINKTQQQHGNSECGVFASTFTIQMLSGKSFNLYTSKDIKNVNDIVIHSFRKILFNNYKNNNNNYKKNNDNDNYKKNNNNNNYKKNNNNYIK